MMNIKEAEKILNLKTGYSIYDVRNAYRVLMTNGNLIDDAKAEEAFMVLSNELGAYVPDGRPNVNLDPEKASRVIRNIAGKLRRNKDAESLMKYELDPPPYLPAIYRIVRFPVQHAPYRLLFFAFVNLMGYLQQTFAQGDVALLLLAWAGVNLGFVNLMFPIVTRPIRQKLLDVVDNIFGISWEWAGNSIVAVDTRKKLPS